VLEASFLNLSDRFSVDGAVSVSPAWEVREDGGATAWYDVRLEFGDGARIDMLAVVTEASVSIEEVRAQPALSLDDLTVLADWVEGPLLDGCGIGAEPDPGATGVRRARPVSPRGIEGQWLVAREYRAAQAQGADPVLAVMRATGHSRRTSLRLIGQARDAGFLTPRRARR
jgi:hypothetical protein